MSEADQMSESSISDDSAAAFAELSTLAVSARPLAEVLQRTTELTRAVMGPSVEVSVTLIDGDAATTPAATCEWTLTLDETQYAYGHGPCLDAARAGHLALIADVAGDGRWPAFAEAAVRAGVISMASVPLPVQRHVVGALNLYARQSGIFDADRMQLAEQFASYAGVAIGHTALYLTSARLAAQMHEAMASRAVIEQAKGILMAVHHCDEDAAFARLVRASQRDHQKLREVARDIVRRVVG